MAQQGSFWEAAQPPQHGALTARERAARWALWSIEGVGPKRMARLLTGCDGTLATLWEDATHAHHQLAALRLSDAQAASARARLARDPEEGLARELEALGSHATLLHRADEAFPPALAALPLPPEFIQVRGALSALHAPTRVALVGSRAARPDHLIWARRLSRQIVAREGAVISGGALGMDAAAHEGALDGHGVTVAVLPGGLKRITPRANAALLERVAQQGGALLSEYPCEVAARTYHFARRNLLIAALSQGVVVLRASARGGTLLTAEAALSLGRPLGAAPYEVIDAGALGSLALLRRADVRVITCAQDALALCAASALALAASGSPDAPSRSAKTTGACGACIGGSAGEPRRERWR